MGFRRVQGKTKFVYLPVTPSTVLVKDSLVTFSSGKLIAVTSTTTPIAIEGIIRHSITAADADYAANRWVEVEVPVEKNVVWEFEAISLVAADIGVEVDLVDADTVDRSASAIKVVKPLKVLSTTLGQGYLKINGSY